jgi:hypothetical protein
MGDLHRRGALVLGIAGPETDLGEAELGAPAPLAQAPVQAGGLAVSLAAYGYRNIFEAPGEPDVLAAATDVQAWVDPLWRNRDWSWFICSLMACRVAAGRCCMCWGPMGCVSRRL